MDAPRIPTLVDITKKDKPTVALVRYFQSLQSYIDSNTGGKDIPIGGIIMYNGAFADIPANYALCDGTNGTPDLRGRFIVGAGTEGDIGNTGGSSDAVIPEHSHTMDHAHGNVATNGSHSHSEIKNSSNGTRYGKGSADFYSSTYKIGDNDTHFVFPHLDAAPDAWLGTDVQVGHTHSVNPYNGSTGSEGQSATDANLPPYYELAYIRRMS